MEQVVERLTSAEALALAGLARLLIRMDGRFTDAEREALSDVATSIAVVADEAAAIEPYRGGASAPSPIGEEALYALLDRAGEELVNDAAVRAAALRVTRQEARATIHALLFEVAASDVISAGESTLLDWLAEQWELDTPRDLPGEQTDAG
jgi:hypothetical protein